MSRLSHANLKARDSVFAAGSETYRGDIQAICPPNLEECVFAMEDCCSEAYEAQMLLRNGTQDLPRMARVLSSERIFLLVNEGIIRKYKTDLAQEIEPSITDLIERAEGGLSALQRKEAALKLKVENAETHPQTVPIGTTTSQKLQVRRLQNLVRQRERLEEEAHTLEEKVKAMELRVLDN